MTIEDVLARRTGLELFDWRLAIEAAPVVASHLARELAWAEEYKAAALRDYVVRIERRLSALGLASR